VSRSVAAKWNSYFRLLPEVCCPAQGRLRLCVRSVNRVRIAKKVIVSEFDPVSGLRGTEILRYDRYPNPNEDDVPLAFALSPDGQWLSTSPAPAGPLRILSLRGEPTRVVPVKGLNLRAPAVWTPDGRGLIVTTFGVEAAVVLHLDLDANMQVLWKCESAQMCFGFPSPDGHHLGIYQTRLTSNIWRLENF